MALNNPTHYSNMGDSNRTILICEDESEHSNLAYDRYVKNFHRPENKVIAVHCPEHFTNVTMMSPGRVSELIKEYNEKLDSLKTKFVSRMTDSGAQRLLSRFSNLQSKKC